MAFSVMPETIQLQLQSAFHPSCQNKKLALYISAYYARVKCHTYINICAISIILCLHESVSKTQQFKTSTEIFSAILLATKSRDFQRNIE